MSSIEIQEHARAVARVYFVGEGSPYRGWFVQRYVGVALLTAHLPVSEDADAFEAVSKAADYLSCLPEQIQIEGSTWPQRVEIA